MSVRTSGGLGRSPRSVEGGNAGYRCGYPPRAAIERRFIARGIEAATSGLALSLGLAGERNGSSDPALLTEPQL